MSEQTTDVVLTPAEREALATVLPRNEWEYDPDRFKVEVEAVVERIVAARLAAAVGVPARSQVHQLQPAQTDQVTEGWGRA